MKIGFLSIFVCLFLISKISTTAGLKFLIYMYLDTYTHKLKKSDDHKNIDKYIVAANKNIRITEYHHTELKIDRIILTCRN